MDYAYEPRLPISQSVNIIIMYTNPQLFFLEIFQFSIGTKTEKREELDK